MSLRNLSSILLFSEVENNNSARNSSSGDVRKINDAKASEIAGKAESDAQGPVAAANVLKKAKNNGQLAQEINKAKIEDANTLFFQDEVDSDDDPDGIFSDDPYGYLDGEILGEEDTAESYNPEDIKDMTDGLSDNEIKKGVVSDMFDFDNNMNESFEIDTNALKYDLKAVYQEAKDLHIFDGIVDEDTFDEFEGMVKEDMDLTDAVVSESTFTKQSTVKMSKLARVNWLTSRAAISYARAANDSLYTKLRKYSSLRREMIDAINKKYGSKAKMQAKKMIKSYKASSSFKPTSGLKTQKEKPIKRDTNKNRGTQKKV